VTFDRSRHGYGHGGPGHLFSYHVIRYQRVYDVGAAAFLDRAALDWARQRRRGTCQTNSSDLRARPAAPGGSPTVQALIPTGTARDNARI
jgi:hypothetical protein